jgi:putative membrane protein
MTSHLNEMYISWGWFLWLGVMFLLFSNIGNWRYAYQAHLKYSDLHPRSRAFGILNERLERGEINREEYTRIKSFILAQSGIGPSQTAGSVF